MVFSENFRIAARALRANKMRSILTTLGIIIGVAAVIAVVSIVQGLQFMITKELQGVGATYVMVLPDQDQNQGPGIVARQVRLTWDDGRAILAQVPGIRMMTPLVGGRSTVKYRDRQHDPDFVFGVNESWPEVSNYTVDRGRFFSRLDLVEPREERRIFLSFCLPLPLLLFPKPPLLCSFCNLLLASGKRHCWHLA